jgi:poly-gamma-glutamate synthesis protein (capsule biosynthesis protein)
MNLCASSDQLSVLQSAGFDLLTVNNNHQDDCSEEGIIQTTQLLEADGFQTLSEVAGIRINEVPEKDVVFIGVDAVGTQLDEESILDTIRTQKSTGNFVIISAHWGNEYQAGPDARQEQLAQDWVDAGADLIWGHHPHVLQRMEWLTASEDGHEALILYSLGNLISDQHMLPDVQRSALIQITVKNNRISKVTVAPFMVNWDSLSLNFDCMKADLEKIMDRLQVDLNSPSGIETGVYSP